MADLNDLARVVDGFLDEPMVIVGSLPDAARDLDLLGSVSAVEALATKLETVGFRRWRGICFSIDDGMCRAVDLHRTDAFELPSLAIDSIFRGMLPVAGFESLCRPAPEHSILLLARRTAGFREPLEPKWVERIERAVHEDPAAWDKANDEAERWGLEDEVRGLRHACSVGGGERRRIARQVRAGLRGIRGVRGGYVVSLSGIDGTGKSTQAQVLADAFAAMGFDTRTEWTRITFARSLDWIARPVKVVLRLRRRLTTSSRPDLVPEVDPMRALRGRSGLVDRIWVTIVALVDAAVLRRTTMFHVRRGQLVFRDRYVLDSVVQLLDQYGHQHQLAARVLHRLVRPPLCAFLLDTAPELAWQRKPEEFSSDELARHRESYLRRAGPTGVHIVDANRGRDEISMELIARVCVALG
ncbi:hypothetical protein BH24ACT3_BH24ACT3_05310 [soil metagenome]